MTKIKKIVSAVYWQDAAYSLEKNLPKELPPIEITFGVIVKKNKEFINLAMNVNRFSKTNKLSVKDGFLIPIKSILKIEKIGEINA